MQTDDPRTVAETIRKVVANCFDVGVFGNDPVVAAIAEDVDGMLAGQTNGSISQGQPRLASQLIRLAELSAERSHQLPEEFFSAVGTCAEAGLSAEGQHLARTGRQKGHVSNLEK